MNKIFLSLIIVLSSITFSTGQKIEITKEFRGYRYHMYGNSLGLNELEYLMFTNPEAMVYIKRAKSENTTSSVIGFIGGGLIGWPLGSLIVGKNPNWTLAAIGAGLILISIPISMSVHRSAKQAVDIYNASFEDHSLKTEHPSFNLTAKGNGVGLVMSF